MNSTTKMIFAAACLAFGCGAMGCSGALPSKAAVDQASLPSHSQGSSTDDASTRSDGQIISQLRLDWGKLNALGSFALLLRWRGALLLRSQREDMTQLWTLDEEPRDHRDLRLKKLLDFRGELLGIAARHDGLLLLHRSGPSVSLSRVQPPRHGDGRAHWWTLRTFAQAEAPRYLRHYANETLLFGAHTTYRMDGQRLKLVAMPQAHPGRLQQVQCNEVACVALFENRSAPMLLTASWQWTELDVVFTRPENAEPMAAQRSEIPRQRELLLNQERLAYVADGMVYTSPDLRVAPLERVPVPRGLLSVRWFGDALARVFPRHIALQRWNKEVHLRLPTLLSKTDARQPFQLLEMQVLGPYVLLKSTESAGNFTRYHLAQRK